MRRLLVGLGLVVTVVFGYLAVRDADLGMVIDALGSMSAGWLVPALAVLALSIFIRALRWRFLFPREDRPPVSAVTGALLVGYLFNNVLPARAGEAARVIALHQRAGTSRASSAGTVVIERAYDVLCLLVLLFVALPWLPEVSWLSEATALAAGLAVTLAVAIIVLAVFGDRPVRRVLLPLARLPFFSAERVEQAARNLASGLAAIRHPGLATAAFLWTTLSWLVMAFSFWLVMVAFDLELPPVAGLFVLIAVGLAMILPSSPAALGVFEAATVAALAPYAISNSLALSYGLVLHAINVVLYLAAGGVVLAIYGRRPRSRDTVRHDPRRDQVGAAPSRQHL